MEEESEACYYKDLDVALSYIDEKLQSVLGHFQKDFEGLVLADKLGAKFGEYGTFLPTHQLSSSVTSHPKTPQRAQLYIKSEPLPKYLHVEGAPQKSKVPSDVYVPLSSSKLLKLTAQRTLKVRIKMGSDNKTQKSTGIYCNLGLIPSSSSTVNIPEEVNGVPLEKSAISIIQDLNLFPVLAGIPLSPLHESFLCLVRKENPVRPEDSAALIDEFNSMSANRKVSRQMKTESAGKFETLKEREHDNRMDLNKNMEVENMKSKQCSSSDLKLKRLPHLIGGTRNSLKGAKRDAHVKERKIDRNWFIDKFSSSEEQDAQNSSMEKIREDGKSNSIKISIPFKTDSDLLKRENYSNTGSVDHVQEKVAPKVMLPKHDDVKVPQSSKENSFDGQQKSHGIRNNGKLGSESDFRAGKNERKSSHKVARKVTGNCEDALDIRLEQTDSKMNLLKRRRPFGDWQTVKGKQAPREGGPPPTEGCSPEAESGSVGPVILQEDWVCCDSCHKWRLLPFGTKPDQLPEKWLCSMINWLPGMNRCNISEEETTKALNALYQLPLPESQNNLQSQNNQSRHNLGSNGMPNPGRKNKSKTSTMNKSNVQYPSTENHGVKEIPVNVRVDSKRKRLVSKRESNQNGYNTKKFKTEGALHTKHNEDCYSKCTKLEPKDGSVISVKKKRDSTWLYMDNGSLDMKTSDERKISLKKRKLKEVGSHLTLDDIDLTKKGLGSEQIPVSAISSCSKISGSRKRSGFQEPKGSPVESVSSSPMRISNLGKLSPTRGGILGKGNAKNGNFESGRVGAGTEEGDSEGVLHPEFGGNAQSAIKSSEIENHQLNSNTDDFRLNTIHYCNIERLPHKLDKKCSEDKDLRGPIHVKRNTSNQTATSLLKEAEDLVNLADHLKESGCEVECNDMYFKAAQKFLHGASLLEANKDGSSKYREITQIQIYSNAAKLCK